LVINSRDEAQTKIIALREKAEKEYQSYIQEIKELDRALEHDRKLKEFMATKTMHRTGQPLSAKTGVKKGKRN
jgi:coiled-coil domain-containing protein 63/114